MLTEKGIERYNDLEFGNSIKLRWNTQLDTAEQIANDTQDAYSFDAFQMPYWIKLAQHFLDWGLNGEEVEELLRSKYTRWLRDASDFSNYKGDGDLESFNKLLEEADKRKDEIINSARRFIEQAFKSGDLYNTRTRARFEDERKNQASLKLSMQEEDTNYLEGWPLQEDPIAYMKMLQRKMYKEKKELINATNLAEQLSIESGTQITSEQADRFLQGYRVELSKKAMFMNLKLK
jgi:hypothetical protein